jgi:hypothetical protein
MIPDNVAAGAKPSNQIEAGMKYVWLVWSGTFLIPWAVLYFVKPGFRRKMLRVSMATSLLGLSEPIFVPEYWNPPSLFDLAQRTGFDIESLVFCFAIGGIGAVMYNALANKDIVCCLSECLKAEFRQANCFC